MLEWIPRPGAVDPTVPDTDVATPAAVAALAAEHAAQAWRSYATDAWQRAVLTLDVMRERGNVFLDHLHAGKPALLKFDHELLMHGRDLPQPCNYSLLRIEPPAGVSVDPARRPIVVIDPRAGHGPGIGGFKPDSEIGVALRAGHPVYFITFEPEPVEGQTLLAVARAEALFIEEVGRRHPKAPGLPAVIGNCQAGWAVAALAAVRSDLMGPIVLNGAPLSYWAGSPQQNPMRYAGGALGGAWLSALSADLSGDRFDGAYLVSNFENLNLANTWWDKYYNLYANVDTERERFLDFERWWGGYFRMTGQEIEAIVENLFIGNRLARGEVEMEGYRLDLRQIAAPMVIFASWGDNITPPQQALDWIIDVWGSEKALVKAGRTIVYMLHPRIGHLGIFVGGSVARREHEQIVDTLELIAELPPGLYEMKIDARDPDAPLAALESGDYSVSFELRTVDDLRALNPEGRRDEALFSTIAQVSELNMRNYRQWLQPLVRGVGNKALGEWLRWQHPLRQQHLALSNLHPLAPWIRLQAENAREHRQPIDGHNPWLAWEQLGSRWISEGLDRVGQQRDAATVRWVEAVYGPNGLGAVLPPRETDQAAGDAHAAADEAEGRRVALAQVNQGGFQEAVCRILLAGMAHRGVVQRRGLILGQMLADAHERMAAQDAQVAQVAAAAPTASATPSEDWATVLHRQALVVTFARNEAIAAVPRLLPDLADREHAVALASAVLMAESELTDPGSPASRYLHSVLGVDPGRVAALAQSLSAQPAATVSIAASPAPKPPRPPRASASTRASSTGASRASSRASSQASSGAPSRTSAAAGSSATASKTTPTTTPPPGKARGGNARPSAQPAPAAVKTAKTPRTTKAAPAPAKTATRKAATPAPSPSRRRRAAA
ncbi:hypothetical protein CDN99_22935 [Roseateles aquatilis]|uniref:Poly(3-hydroxyalkanoate) synthetase n=1 Tax=Roseateles aquatilis TaxID=431061 RepID=A0A246IXZ6_9BURK|nr:DUF3141 domain-containing protein [Roseateles aquatilis]OWQ85071.1 hypothetical protein CDN99_22935 [Roseateles aquatilis]